jgi:hypothetical protein
MSGLSPWNVLHAELARSRRYRRTFALVQVQVLSGATPHVRRRPHRRTRLVGVASGPLRTTDYAWSDGRRLLIMLPECGEAEARRLVERMEQELRHAVDVGTARIAVFPDHGVTSGALLTRINGGDSEPSMLSRQAAAADDPVTPVEPPVMVLLEDSAAGVREDPRIGPDAALPLDMGNGLAERESSS